MKTRNFAGYYYSVTPSGMFEYRSEIQERFIMADDENAIYKLIALDILFEEQRDINVGLADSEGSLTPYDQRRLEQSRDVLKKLNDMFGVFNHIL